MWFDLTPSSVWTRGTRSLEVAECVTNYFQKVSGKESTWIPQTEQKEQETSCLHIYLTDIPGIFYSPPPVVVPQSLFPQKKKRESIIWPSRLLPLWELFEMNPEDEPPLKSLRELEKIETGLQVSKSVFVLPRAFTSIYMKSKYNSISARIAFRLEVRTQATIRHILVEIAAIWTQPKAQRLDWATGPTSSADQ